MSDLLKTLVREAKKFAKKNGITMATLAGKAVGDGKLFQRIEQGRGIEIGTYEKFLKYLRDADKPAKGIIGNVDKSGRLGALLGVEPRSKARARRARPSGGRSGPRPDSETGSS